MEEIKIKPNKNIENPEERELRIRSMFGNDFEKGKGMLAKVLVFIQMNQPVTISDLRQKISEFYSEDFDRTQIYRAIQKISTFKLIEDASPNEIMFSYDEDERSPLHNLLMHKHSQFIKKIPPAFRTNYSNVSYYWVANGDGIKYLPFCCKLLGFEIEGIKDNPPNKQANHQETKYSK